MILANVSEGKRLRLSRSTSTKCKPTKNESSKRKKTKQNAPETNKKKRKCLFPEVPDPRYIPSTSTGITAGDDYDEGIFQAASSDSDFE